MKAEVSVPVPFTLSCRWILILGFMGLPNRRGPDVFLADSVCVPLPGK
jgi:hypothetical protein